MLRTYLPSSLDLPTVISGFTYCRLGFTYHRHRIYLPSSLDLPTIVLDLPTVVSWFTYSWGMKKPWMKNQGMKNLGIKMQGWNSGYEVSHSLFSQVMNITTSYNHLHPNGQASLEIVVSSLRAVLVPKNGHLLIFVKQIYR